MKKGVNMGVEITYIVHNCFLLRLDALPTAPEFLLFDPPKNQYLTTGARKLLRERIAGGKVTVFISHSHGDHFRPDLLHLLDMAETVRLVLAAEVREAFPDTAKWPGVLFVEPDQTYTSDRWTINPLQSNDLGVAYLLETGGRRIYFGGDLADWDWDDFTPEERQEIVTIYRKNFEILRRTPLDIAFVNTDPRLKSWAGALEFLTEMRPGLFVPMHFFGRTQSLERFMKEAAGLGNQRIFTYKQSGDKVRVSY